jgi:hypothetical protein
MRCRAVLVVLLALAFVGLGRAGEAGNAKKPRLGLRASPRVATSPVSVLVVAELRGGEEHEDFYCPGLEWDWGDGTRSSHESDCPPYEAGTILERRFSARHAYHAPGEYHVRLTLRRSDRTVAAASVPLIVHGGLSGLEDD